VKKNTSKAGEEIYICMFCGRAIHLDDFVFGAREWRKCGWTMLKTHIMINLLIFCLIFLLVLRPVFLLDLTIAHMALVHERVGLCVDPHFHRGVRSC
jgi:hypothetical protein